MNSLIFLSFILMIIGLFIIFKVSIFDVADNIKLFFERKKRESIRVKIKKVTKREKKQGIRYTVLEAKEILRLSGKAHTFHLIVISSFVLPILGIFIALTMNNFLLIPVMIIGFFLMPFWYIKLISVRWKTELNEELETALSVITTSYMRNESIITAIEENIDYINPPVQDVFRDFLLDTKLINSNIKMALESLKRKIDSEVFREWVDAIITCQEDKTLKSTLTPITVKFSDMRIISGELNNLLYEPVKEFVMMAGLLIFNIPLIYILNREWYETLMFTVVGKVVLAITLGIFFISIAGVVKNASPVEYRR